MSKAFQKNNPAAVQRIHSSLDKSFCSADVPLLIMDIAGFHYARKNDEYKMVGYSSSFPEVSTKWQ